MTLGIMLTSLTAIAIDSSTFYDWLAKASGAVALWASARAHRAEIHESDPEVRIQALTLQVRHPWQSRIARARRWMS